MSIVIRGMEMPTSCHNCELSAKVDLSYGIGYCCQLLAEMIGNNFERKSNCPLIPVPPHGRLIDADALLLKIDCHGTNKFGILDEDIREFINEVPTVIPAEEGE